MNSVYCQRCGYEGNDFYAHITNQCVVAPNKEWISGKWVELLDGSGRTELSVRIMCPKCHHSSIIICGEITTIECHIDA